MTPPGAGRRAAVVAACAVGGLLVTATLAVRLPPLMTALVGRDDGAATAGPGALPVGPDIDVVALVDDLDVAPAPAALTAETYGTTAMLAAMLTTADEAFGIAIVGRPTVVFPALDSYLTVADTDTFVRGLVDGGHLGGGLVTVTTPDEAALPDGVLLEVVVEDVVVPDGAALAGFGPVTGETFGDDEAEVFQLIVGDYRQTWWVLDDAGEPVVVVVELPMTPDETLATAVRAQADAWVAAVDQTLVSARAATTPTAAGARSGPP